jgi:hypothetical protein
MKDILEAGSSSVLGDRDREMPTLVDSLKSYCQALDLVAERMNPASETCFSCTLNDGKSPRKSVAEKTQCLSHLFHNLCQSFGNKLQQS